MSAPIGPCLRCGVLPQLRPAYGWWFWQCNCPPPITYTSDNTVAPPLPDAGSVSNWLQGDGETIRERRPEDDARRW